MVTSSDDKAPSAQVEAIVRAHGARVRRALRQLGVAPHLLDDAAQDVFVVLVRRVEDFDRARSLTNWLWGIAKGVASGYRRSGRRRGRLHSALAQTVASPRPGTRPGEVGAHCGGLGRPTWAVSLSCDGRGAERCVAGRQAGAILSEFLRSLDDGKCAVFVLSEVEGCSGPEIAERLSLNVNTVYARLRAARRSFRAAVAGQPERDTRPLFGALFPTLGKPLGWMAAAAVATAWVMPASDLPERGGGMRLAGYLAIPDAAPTVSDRPRPPSEARDQVRDPAGRARMPLPARGGPVATQTGVPDAADILPRLDTEGASVGQGQGRGHSPRRAAKPGDETMLSTLALAAALAAPSPSVHPNTTITTDTDTDADADAAARVRDDGARAVYEFFDEEISGDRLRDDGTVVLQRPPVRHRSLITVRGHFIGELLLMATDV